jgi:hypothetical protein
MAPDSRVFFEKRESLQPAANFLRGFPNIVIFVYSVFF